MSDVTRSEYCAVAIAECFRGDGEIFISPIGTLPMIGIRLAKLSFEPELVLNDGFAMLLENVMPVGAAPDFEPIVEGYLPYRGVFDVLWSGRRHVMMGATQIDRFGNQNIACIGDYAKPKAQLLGMRGAPGNTINHTTSYWVPRHSSRVFVPEVDVVCGIGYDRAAELGPRAARFHEIRRVVSNLGSFDFQTETRTMRLHSLHPGVDVEQVVQNTGFALEVPDEVPHTRDPSAEELRLIREVLDPSGLREREVPS